MYFSDNIRLKKIGDDVFSLSIRVGERKVEEHKVPAVKLREVFILKEGEWVGSKAIQSKKTSNGVMLKIAINVYRSDIYCFSNSEFRFLNSLYLSLS